MTSDRLTGRVNALIAACLRAPDSAVKPHARLREDLHAGPLELMRLAIALSVDLGIEPQMWGHPEDDWCYVGNVHAWAIEQAAAKVPA